jgi:hypothetical protein
VGLWVKYRGEERDAKPFSLALPEPQANVYCVGYANPSQSMDGFGLINGFFIFTPKLTPNYLGAFGSFLFPLFLNFRLICAFSVVDLAQSLRF